jgi:hypothetical protein
MRIPLSTTETTALARASAAWLACACLAAAGCSDSHAGTRDAEAIDQADADSNEQDADSNEQDADSNERDAGSAERDADAPSELPDAGGSEAPADAAADATRAPDGAPSCRTADGRTPDVDLLFVIDNSGSMAEEQQKLARRLPELLGVLATGNRDGKRAVAGEPTDFAPAQTIHVGVISTDLGVNLAPPIESCGGASFHAAAPDPANTTSSVRSMPLNGERLDKPFGDQGALQTSTVVAEAGIWARPYGTLFSTPVSLVVEPDPSCAAVRPGAPYLEYTAGDQFESVQHAFSCIAKLGKNGCGLEQQLESTLKALAPSSVAFSRNTYGQGTAPGLNAGFLRDDAVLAIVIVSDEEDCSIPDESSDLFNRNSISFQPGDINTRCGKPENQRFLHPVQRYVDGLRALKSEDKQERIVVASITGLPLAKNLDGKAAHQGMAELEAILARPDMQFAVRPSNISVQDEEPLPTCESAQGDGSAAPGRRLLQLAQAFGDNGVAASICEDDYGAMVALLGERIAGHLGSCE